MSTESRAFLEAAQQLQLYDRTDVTKAELSGLSFLDSLIAFFSDNKLTSSLKIIQKESRII